MYAREVLAQYILYRKHVSHSLYLYCIINNYKIFGYDNICIKINRRTFNRFNI